MADLDRGRGADGEDVFWLADGILASPWWKVI